MLAGDQDRDQMLGRAERAVRRGDLGSALELFERLARAHPSDEHILHRRDSIRQLAQSGELSAAPVAPDESASGDDGQLPPAEEGERHAAAGRFDRAAECYRRAVEENPGSELLRERYQELLQLAPPSESGAKALANAPRIDTGPLPTPARAAEPLPSDPVALLNALLERIAAHRRR